MERTKEERQDKSNSFRLEVPVAFNLVIRVFPALQLIF